MKPYDELTYRGQALRIREIAEEAVERLEILAEKLELIFHGENTTFRARNRSAGDFLVRVHRPGYQTRRTIRSELELLVALDDAGFVVPRPVGPGPGAVLRLDAPGVEARNVAAFEWIPGRFSSSFSPRSMHRLGEFAARLHRFAESFVPGERFVRQFWHTEGLTGENMGGGIELLPEKHRGLVEETIDRAADVLDDLGRGHDVWGLIHADLHHGNRLVYEGELAAIDFDDCGFGYYLYDLAVMLGYPRRKFGETFDDELLPAFLRGYRSVRPLSDEHVHLLPVFYALRAVAIGLWVLGRAEDNPYFADRAADEVAGLVRSLESLASMFP